MEGTKIYVVCDDSGKTIDAFDNIDDAMALQMLLEKSEDNFEDSFFSEPRKHYHIDKIYN